MSHALLAVLTAGALASAPATGSSALVGDAQPADAPPPEPAAPAPAPAPSEATSSQPSEPATDPAPTPAPIETTTLRPTAAEPAPAPQPAPAATAAPSPAPPGRDGRALLTAGGIMMGVGGASLLFVAVPAVIVRNSALRRAQRDALLAFSTRKDRYERARRADDAMEAGFWIGVPLVATGLALVITGAMVRSNARSQRRYGVAPGGLEIRF